MKDQSGLGANRHERTSFGDPESTHWDINGDQFLTPTSLSSLGEG